MAVRIGLAALAALALAACGQGGDQGKDASTANDASTTERVMARISTPQDNLSADERAQLEGVIRDYLSASAAQYAAGFSPLASGGESIAPLQPLTNHDFTVPVSAGVTYRVVGGCDNECNNVDLEVRDAGGAVVASDAAPDDHPVVSFTPTASGTYSVRLLLKTCTIAPCYVGARVLQQS
ncbi:MAG: PPC domain-containing protein [Hyphomonadaceae bacterium]|nr:PPC domain-containing protein [Hyphomonadaceae bacterium]